MSACICCGSPDGDERFYVCVETATETTAAEKAGRKKRITRETVKELSPYAVCPACAGKAKTKAVLWTVPITLLAVPVMIVMSWFSAKPNRDIKREVASYPVAIPLIAVILWLCGLSVYLPRPKELYAAELVRKKADKPLNAFLVPLEAKCYTRRDRPVRTADVMYRVPVKTELAEKLLPVINGEADAESLRPLVGETFVKEEEVTR